MERYLIVDLETNEVFFSKWNLEAEDDQKKRYVVIDLAKSNYTYGENEAKEIEFNHL